MFGSNSAWGQQNNQQQQQQPQQTGGLFGGGAATFGQPQQQNTGFGATTSTFGQPAQQNTGGGLFGSNANNNTSFTFGANTAQNNNTFGASRPGFGSAGSSTFGQPANTGGMFGSTPTQPASTFGSTPTSTNTLFGKPATTTPTFGSGVTSNLFGAKPSSPFGAPTAPSSNTNFNGVNPYETGPFGPPPPTGTAQPPYQPTWQSDPSTMGGGTKQDVTHLFHSISAMGPYKGASWDELRMLDYQQDRKDATAQPVAGFGATNPGGFGQTPTNTFGQPAQSTSPFGAPKPGGLFGAAPTGTTGFGQSSGGFGASTTNSGMGAFGQQPQQPQNNLFGSTNTITPSSTGLFGQQPNQQQPQPGGMFGSTSGGLFGQSNQQSQQQQGTTSTFGFGQPKPAFGTGSTTTFGQPAQPANTFGQPAQANTNTFTFGQTAQQPQQQSQAGGLFGGNTTFGQTNAQNAGSSLFGQTNQQQQTQQPATGGVFGSTAAKPGGLFGSTSTSTAPTGGFTFGQNPTSQPATGGLFGAANPTQPATNGLFGQQPQPQQQPSQGAGGLFGGTSTSSLFAPKPAATGASGGLFGGAQTQQPAQTGSLFGNPAQASGGIFGGSTGLMGQQNQQQNASGSGSSIFGAGFGHTQQPQQAAPSSNLFGALGQSQPAQSGMFGSTAQQPAQQSSLGGSLFGNMGQSTMTQPQPQQPTLTASIDQNPYGTNALFNYTGQKLNLGSQRKKPALPPLTTSSFRLTPSRSSQLGRLRGFASPLVSSASPARAGSGSLSLASPSRSVLSSPAATDRYKGLADSAHTPNAFVPRPSIKKLTVNPRATTLSQSEDHLESVLGKSALRTSGANSPQAAPERAPQSPATQLFNPSANGSSSRAPANDSREPASIQNNETAVRKSQSQLEVARATGSDRQPKKGDYWCRPKLEKLKQLGQRDVRELHNFTAGRKGYGEVTFLDPVDLTDLDLLTFLGTVVVFSDMELAVYPDDHANKPPRGKGLNVPAQITLENCVTRDKASKQVITDHSDPRHIRFLKRVKSIPDTEFISYTDNGVWTFKVEHFSRYGLNGSDDESEAEPAPDSVRKAKAKEVMRSQSRLSEEDEEMEEDEDMLPPTKSRYDDHDDGDHDSGIEEDESEEDGNDASTEEETDNTSSKSEDVEVVEKDELPEWDMPLKMKLGAEGMRKLREMQAGFFGGKKVSTEVPKQAAVLRTKRALEERIVLRQDFGEAGEGEAALGDRPTKRASFGESMGPPRLRQPRKYARVALKESFVQEDEGIRADAGLALGRSFRCSWGPNGQLVHFGKICAPGGVYTPTAEAQVAIEDVDLLAGEAAVENQRAERLLSLHLKRSTIDIADGSSSATIDPTIRFHDFTHLFDAGDRSHEANVFRLGAALFDEIDLRLPAGADDELVDRIAEIRRKLALSKWLEDAVAPAVDHDLVHTDSGPGKVLAMLSGHQVERAVQSALEGNDMRLATLLSQIGGPQVFRNEIMRQLDDWKKYKATPLISKEYRRLYALLAGITDISPGDPSRGSDNAPDVLIADGLDWKRAFGLRLWFGCAFESTIGDVLDSYISALSSKPSPAKPLPPYLEKPTSEKGWNIPTVPADILFNLILLYSDATISLDQTLRARDCSASPFDYRLPWHLYMLLSRVLAKRDFEDRDVVEGYSANADAMTSAYASQLEVGGEWRWAAFVLLHLETAGGREQAIKALLHRHPEPTSGDIDFLTKTLHIPIEWIHKAKADLLASRGEVYAEFHELILAGSFDRAHRILVTKLAPEAVLLGDLVLLRRLCERLEESRADGWEYGGKLYLDYANILEETPRLLSSVIQAGSHPDPKEAATLTAFARSLPRLLQLLPALFPDKENVQQIAGLSDMLSALHQLAGQLHTAGYISRPAVPPLLVDVDRLHLLQAAAFDSFSRTLEAVTAAA